MENQSKQCFRCRYCDRYYTKGIKQFNKTKAGWCGQKHAIVLIHESCDHFSLKSGRKPSRQVLKCCLNNLLTELSAIRSIIEVNCNENDENEEM